ncbi:hypothetical protein MTX26_02220 [Bradyrhizobium sp. ISRA443]|uniref:hypothetical protein n=1 Tax=unclassified Bradyrhizobium TaxID=2631580 RepID=UPI00247942E4|nr:MULTISPECIES: hypothetical protein [unclassified Bradyrhizobium]WGR94859.1 hypothetical protein MTX20_12255 [Bradyrhizobium sp. ISRA435]WGR99713.1 hypothetical protein MTX23_02220 [Bradyrhizobium sp. ISRA436]WGS06603.1 hypothetical protein MTX18_02220 [Bradyrhizobium sp. ISRA437]WGS13487.1 hypothetical protein MTX26_02220 [Bradyrhizobium sp. ISRA443]
MSTALQLIVSPAITSIQGGELPPWQDKATQDHVKKLFWCFYSPGTVEDIVDQRQFFEKRNSASGGLTPSASARCHMSS